MDDSGTTTHSEPVEPADHAQLRRRTVLAGLGLGGVGLTRAAGLIGAAGLVGATARPAAAAPTRRPSLPWAGFARGVAAEARRMNLVGAAVAVVTPDQVVHRQTLGVRELGRRTPVTESTSFLVASTTKSMSSLLVATHVDQGRFGWDDRAVDVWPGFRAPTDELTGSLRVRDLLGMGTGLGEPSATSATHQGDPTAEQLLQSLVNLPVEAKPEERWIYNNTVYSVGSYLPLLHGGTDAGKLSGVYGSTMRTLMRGADTGIRIVDDPRGVVSDYARGNGLTLSGQTQTMPYAALGSFAPVGGALATVDDMAAYLQLQLRKGESRSGRRVVSAENLAECWKPHVAVPVSPELDPDAVSAGYGMGWIRTTYRDGTSLVWHNGAIDGFTTFMGFLPEHEVGLVVLNAMSPFPSGFWFYTYVLNLLLSTRFDLNEGVPAKVHDVYEQTMADLRANGRRARPVDRSAVQPYLGYYEGGYRLELSGSELLLHQGSRVLGVTALVGGGFMISSGLLLQQPVELRRDVDGTPMIAIEGLETVRRNTGLG